jgi:spore coat protein CotF
VAGDAYCPLLVLSNPAVRRVFDKAIQEEIDLQIEIGLSAYVNSEIFERYCDTLLIPVTGLSRNLGI